MGGSDGPPITDNNGSTHMKLPEGQRDYPGPRVRHRLAPTHYSQRRVVPAEPTHRVVPAEPTHRAADEWIPWCRRHSCRFFGRVTWPLKLHAAF